MQSSAKHRRKIHNKRNGYDSVKQKRDLAEWGFHSLRRIFKL